MKEYVRTISIKDVDSEKSPLELNSLVKNPEEELKGKFRFAVYGSFGDFLGYKLDSFWSLDKTGFKDHSLTKKISESNYINNLLYGFNKWDFKFDGKFDNKSSLYIVAEDILSEEGIAGLCISKDKNGMYSLNL